MGFLFPFKKKIFIIFSSNLILKEENTGNTHNDVISVAHFRSSTVQGETGAQQGSHSVPPTHTKSAMPCPVERTFSDLPTSLTTRKTVLYIRKTDPAGFISHTVKSNTSRKEMNVVFFLGLKMVVETTQDRTANTCGEDVFSLPTQKKKQLENSMVWPGVLVATRIAKANKH